MTETAAESEAWHTHEPAAPPERHADAIRFLALGGLFTAHITGTIVILASHLVTHGTAGMAQLLSVPVFMLVLELARLLSLSLSSRGAGAALQALLGLQVDRRPARMADGLPALLLPTFLATVAARRGVPDGRVISTP